MIKLIAACGKNGEIGKDNQLLFKYPEDMRNFKEVTTGHHVVMGRKTCESTGKKPLPHRGNLVITSSVPSSYQNLDKDNPMNYLAFFSLDSVMNGRDSLRESHGAYNSDYHHFIIGGGQLYDYFLKNDLVDEIILTLVHKDFPDADTFIDLELIAKRFDIVHAVEYDNAEFVIVTLRRNLLKI